MSIFRFAVRNKPMVELAGLLALALSLMLLNELFAAL